MSNSWVCVDASLVIRLVADPHDAAVKRLWEQWDAEGRQPAAPALLYYEVVNALYRYQKLGFMGPSSVRLAFEAVLALPIRLHGAAELHWRALDLAARLSLRPPTTLTISPWPKRLAPRCGPATGAWSVPCRQPCPGCTGRRRSQLLASLVIHMPGVPRRSTTAALSAQR